MPIQQALTAVEEAGKIWDLATEVTSAPMKAAMIMASQAMHSKMALFQKISVD